MWWIKMAFITIISAFFLVISGGNLISAYQLKNPAEFVMTFFSQSLMLMISVVGIIYAVIQITVFLKRGMTEYKQD